MGYNTIALDVTYTGKLPADITNGIPEPLPCSVPPTLKVLRRCTLLLSDPSQNHRLSSLAAAYDILALRPTTEASFQQASQSLDCDIISLDLTQRFPFFFKQKTCSAALQRGIKFEINYAPSIHNSDGGTSKKNLISNTTQLIRATRGKGIILSSEAKNTWSCRGPVDLINLATLWGLPQDRATEAVSKQARLVVTQAEMRRRSFRGVIDVVHGGKEAPQVDETDKDLRSKETKGKRKLGALDSPAPAPLSKRERKRQAKMQKIQETESKDE